jgi:hypothetical protein
MVALQIGLLVHCALLVHSTQTPAAVSQRGAFELGQSSLPVQGKPQTCSIGEQALLTAQSLLAPHSWHWPKTQIDFERSGQSELLTQSAHPSLGSHISPFSQTPHEAAPPAPVVSPPVPPTPVVAPPTPVPPVAPGPVVAPVELGPPAPDAPAPALPELLLLPPQDAAAPVKVSMIAVPNRPSF